MTASAPPSATVFVTLYKQGLIYRDRRLVNWDPKFQSAISDLEVESTRRSTASSGRIRSTPSRGRTRSIAGRHYPPRNDARRHRRRRPSRPISASPTLIGRMRRATPHRPPLPHRRRRLLRPGKRHRRGEDHPRPRLQRFRGRPPPRASPCLPSSTARAASRWMRSKPSLRAITIFVRGLAGHGPLRRTQGRRRRAGRASALPGREVRTASPRRSRTATAAAFPSSRCSPSSGTATPRRTR